MTDKKKFDVIIIGGSYAGLSAALALGRALRNVLVIDSGKPANRFTPTSHNFLTRDAKPPAEISGIARSQLLRYDNIHFLDGLANSAMRTSTGFIIGVATGEKFSARKLVFATGIKDLVPEIEGMSDCWGISVLHCPYCHGYEVRDEPTGILGNGDYAYEFSALIHNWTRALTLFTNGPSTLSAPQTEKLRAHGIGIVEKEIGRLEHFNGHLRQINFRDGTTKSVKALYTRVPFRQHSDLPETLGCELTDDGYIKVDATQKSSIDGVFACGDNTTPMRTVSTAVAAGTIAAMTINKELVSADF